VHVSPTATASALCVSGQERQYAQQSYAAATAAHLPTGIRSCSNSWDSAKCMLSVKSRMEPIFLKIHERAEHDRGPSRQKMMKWSCQDTRMSRSSLQVHLSKHTSSGSRQGIHSCKICRSLSILLVKGGVCDTLKPDRAAIATLKSNLGGNGPVRPCW
jgi:hypothetical protein